ncbi:MAG: hypothetical protein LYZ70_06310 [Nitrososphaerales archaeon]|nr:hypothetical protein [Nitrososphaerales archaeon]
MKVKILLDDEVPKVPLERLEKTVRESGLELASKKADVGLVVGGDGVFGRFGSTETIPLLFVGVRSESATGSRAFLASAFVDELPRALSSLASGQYKVRQSKRLEVMKNGRSLGRTFTDVYLQRGAESNCIRYSVKVSDVRSFEDVAIGDGVVVTTAAGSTGYYSYPDKIRGDGLDVAGHSMLREDQIGICHIIPTFTSRSGTKEHPLRCAVPWGTKVEISITRRADARLYGVGPDRGGVKVSVGDAVLILPSEETTKVIVL